MSSVVIATYALLFNILSDKYEKIILSIITIVISIVAILAVMYLINKNYYCDLNIGAIEIVLKKRNKKIYDVKYNNNNK